MASTKLLAEPTLKAIIASNSKLANFLEWNNMHCSIEVNGIKFSVVNPELNRIEREPVVTVKWTNNYLTKFSADAFEMDVTEFAKIKECRAATALVANSIFALYLAGGPEIRTSNHLKVGFPRLSDRDFETAHQVVPLALRRAVKLGLMPKQRAEGAFSFTMNMLPTQIVGGEIYSDWEFPSEFERFADLSFEWLRKIWSTWSTVFEFHKAAPCGIGIYAWAAGGQKTIPLDKRPLEKDKVYVAMHDAMYPNLANEYFCCNTLKTVHKSKKP